MNKRLRKKYHLKEFTEYGFAVGFRFNCEDEKQREALANDFITTIESLGLEFGGGGSENEWAGFIAPWKGSATEPQREAMTQWFKNNPMVTAYAVAPMTDAWSAPMETYSESLEFKAK